MPGLLGKKIGTMVRMFHALLSKQVLVLLLRLKL